MHGESVPERMWRDRFGKAREGVRRLTGHFDRGAGDRLPRGAAREQTPSRPYSVPVVAQHLQQLGREHHIAVLPPLALVDMDDHPLPVDGARHQVNCLADAQAGGVAGGQDGPLLDARDTAEKMQHLLGTENDRQGPRLLGTGHRAKTPPPAYTATLVNGWAIGAALTAFTGS